MGQRLPQPAKRVVRVVIEVDLEDLLRQLLQAGALVEPGSDPEALRLSANVVAIEQDGIGPTNLQDPPATGSSPHGWPSDRPLTPRMVAYLARCSNNVVSDALASTDVERLDGKRMMLGGIETTKWQISLAAAEGWIATRTKLGYAQRRTVADLASKFSTR